MLGWVLGLLYGTATSGGQALYGYFSMNLNALWNPAGVNGVLYSRFLPAQNQVGGNYDAFAYLGLGVLIALPIAVVAARKRLAALLRRHWALCAVFVVLTAFAVSHVITANGLTLVTLPLPASLIKLFSVFRSGGRARSWESFSSTCRRNAFRADRGRDNPSSTRAVAFSQWNGVPPVRPS